jgi:hypothetical protein
MKRVKLIFLTAALMLFAVATMAPHYTSFGRLTVVDVPIQGTITGWSESKDGRSVQATADVRLRIESDSSSGVPTEYRGKMRFTARPSCVRACGDSELGSVDIRGEIKFVGQDPGIRVQGQGTVSGVSNFSDVSGLGSEFFMGENRLRVRIGILEQAR